MSDLAVTPQHVADHYDELDPFYRALWGEHVHHGYWDTGRESPEAAVEALIDRLAARLDLAAGAALCDVGCGYGATARHLARRHGVRVTGITLSPVQAARARERAAEVPGIDILCGDWLSNDLPDAAFDAVVAIESIEHMADADRAFAEAHRVLRPGGRLGVCLWLAADAPAAWQERHLLGPIAREGRLPGGLKTAGTYLAHAARAGFGDLALEDVSRNVRRTWTICCRRVARAVVTDARARTYLLSSAARNRVFAATLPRLLLAFRTGAMRYGIMTGRRRA